MPSAEAAAAGQARSHPSARRAVFLHGMWRSGSTFLWSRFRAADETLCFYEPLHHGLAKLTHERISRESPDLATANGHPTLTSPYFSEFAPLIARRGVRGYRKAFAEERFALEPGAVHAPLRRYIGGLIAHADQAERTAVLGFNRAGLRIGWLRRNFIACNIHIDRDPAAIWASYETQAARGNFAFYTMWLRVIEANAADPLWAPLVERLGLHPIAARFSLDAKRRHRALIERMDAEERYFLVFYAWLALMRQAVETCDLVIDTHFAGDPAYLGRLSRQIGAASGLSVDLGGLRPTLAGVSAPPLWLRANVERAVVQAFGRPKGAPMRLRANEKLAGLCARKADILAALA